MIDAPKFSDPGAVAYAGFFKGGGPGNLENLRIMKTRMKIFQPETNSVFLPKIR